MLWRQGDLQATEPLNHGLLRRNKVALQTLTEAAPPSKLLNFFQL